MRWHMKLNIRGFIRNSRFPQDYGVFEHDDGRAMTPAEAQDMLLDELAKGHTVIPCGKCNNFDYSGGGCQGHRDDEP